MARFNVGDVILVGPVAKDRPTSGVRIDAVGRKYYTVSQLWFGADNRISFGRSGNKSNIVDFDTTQKERAKELGQLSVIKSNHLTHQLVKRLRGDDK